MPDRVKLDQFLAAAINGEGIDFSLYDDPEFLAALRLRAIDAIRFMIDRINLAELHTETTGDTFRLSEHINVPHPDTGLSILDYCLIAGINENDLAQRLAMLGAKSDNSVPYFKKLKENLDPEILNDFVETMRHIRLGMEDSELRSLQKPKEKSYWQRFKGFCKNHKFAILFLLLGIGCATAAPFTGGVTLAILLAIGTSSIVGSLSSIQGSLSLQKTMGQVALDNRTEAETQEIRNLMDLARRAEIYYRDEHKEISSKAKVNNEQNSLKRTYAELALNNLKLSSSPIKISKKTVAGFTKVPSMRLNRYDTA